MIGAVIGDVIGSQFSVEVNRSVYFKSFTPKSRPTGETVVMSSVADLLVRENLKECFKHGVDAESLLNQKSDRISDLLRMGCIYGFSYGFGSLMQQWILNGKNVAFNSSGNGALIRVIPVAFYAVKVGLDFDDAYRLANFIIRLTHAGSNLNAFIHLYLSLLMTLIQNKEQTVDEKKAIITRLARESGFLGHSVDYYRVQDGYDISSERALGVAISSVLEESSYLNAVHAAVSTGAASSANASITGALAKQVFGVDEEMCDRVRRVYFEEVDKDYLLKPIDVILSKKE